MLPSTFLAFLQDLSLVVIVVANEKSNRTDRPRWAAISKGLSFEETDIVRGFATSMNFTRSIESAYRYSQTQAYSVGRKNTGHGDSKTMMD